MKIWAIYNAPDGAPAPLVVLEWDSAPGAAARHGEAMFAANLDGARSYLPPGLERSGPVEHPAEAKGLIETWEAPEA